MLISELNNRAEILSQAAGELKALGISVRGEKIKQIHNKRLPHKKIFKTQLHNLELAEGILSNGVVTEIPKFVLLACTRIQDETRTEGIFRKTGSIIKQQQIVKHLENGGTIEKFHHVIDIANLLKTFFRDLPIPLIPPAIQDALINCLIHCKEYEHKLEAILMTILFLSPIAVNTLAYFLQFLEVIVKNASENFMTVDNLVKVLTPTIMPMHPGNVNQKRLQTLFQIMEMLIQNANLIGIVPDRMIKRDELAPPMTEDRKKKKRRSASLNRVFNGFRKRIVGAISGSSESLDKSQEGVIDGDFTAMTPNITKSAKKRRLEKFDIGAFSSKKKNQQMTLSALPEIDDSSIPCSPYAGENKRHARKSLSEKQEQPKTPPKTRRWSLARENMSAITRSGSKKVLEIKTNDYAPKENDYVRVSKVEYEAFKNRLHTIESTIHEEFQTAKLNAIKAEMGKSKGTMIEDVENKFHETLQEVEKFEDSDRKTDILAKRLSRELKIRPGIENPVMRSPSARKIGSLRRKRESTNMTRLSRGNSWHISSSYDSATTSSNTTEPSTFYPQPNLKRLRMLDSTVTTAPANNLLPTIHSADKVKPEKPARKTAINTLSTETWTNATEFFKDFEPSSSLAEPRQDEIFKTPVRIKKLQIKGDIDINAKTPMLPPRLTTPLSKTPLSDKKTPMINRTLLMTPSNEGGTGREARASIVQIRSQNAGQVALKAKLFDTMSDSLMRSVERPTPIVKLPRVAINKKLESVRGMTSSPAKVPSISPRRSSRSPGINRRLQLRAVALSSPLKVIKENRRGSDRKINLLKNPELLAEIASPRRPDNRKVLSQNNTPRRGGSKTPSSKSSTKKHRTPHRNTPSSKSPRSANRRHQITFD